MFEKFLLKLTPKTQKGHFSHHFPCGPSLWLSKEPKQKQAITTNSNFYHFRIMKGFEKNSCTVQQHFIIGTHYRKNSPFSRHHQKMRKIPTYQKAILYPNGLQYVKVRKSSSNCGRSFGGGFVTFVGVFYVPHFRVSDAIRRLDENRVMR